MKHKIVLEPGEAYVVANTDFWDYVIEVQRQLAREATNKDHERAYREAADHIQHWVDSTFYDEPTEEDFYA